MSRTYDEIARSTDPRDGALRVRVRPLNCSHDEHTVTVRGWNPADDADPALDPTRPVDLNARPLSDAAYFDAAIEDDSLDAEFVGPEPTVEAAIERALTATCEDE